MRNSNKLVCGIGIKGDKYPSWNGVEMLKEKTWLRAFFMRAHFLLKEEYTAVKIKKARAFAYRFQSYCLLYVYAFSAFPQC